MPFKDDIRHLAGLKQQIWQKMILLEQHNGTPKGTSLHETTSFDVSIVKIGAGVLAVGWLKNP